MPPKRSDICHVTFHFYRSAVLLSVPQSTTLSSLKAHLLPALRPFQAALPVSIPKSTSDFRLWVEKEPVEGADGNPGLRELETDEQSEMSKSPLQLGWGRWPKVFVSFKGEDGRFHQPEYTIPDVEDDEVADD